MPTHISTAHESAAGHTSGCKRRNSKESSQKKPTLHSFHLNYLSLGISDSSEKPIERKQEIFVDNPDFSFRKDRLGLIRISIKNRTVG
jgi:hypothetical protein